MRQRQFTNIYFPLDEKLLISIITQANVQDHLFYIVNIYAPNTTKEQCTFLKSLKSWISKWMVI